MASGRRTATRLMLLSVAAPACPAPLRFGVEDEPDPKALDRMRRAASSLPRFDRVLRSATPAAAATAAAMQHGEAETADTLRNRSHGSWSGQELEAVAAAEPDLFSLWLESPDAAPEGGESVRALIGRVQPWLTSLEATGSNLLAIADPAVVRACLVAALACPAEVWFRLDVGYGSRSLLTYNGGCWRVSLVNAPL